jgi:hypothetical protein
MCVYTPSDRPFRSCILLTTSTILKGSFPAPWGVTSHENGREGSPYRSLSRIGSPVWSREWNGIHSLRSVDLEKSLDTAEQGDPHLEREKR